MVVHTRPLAIAGQDFILYSMQDISHEKRRQALERIFFHDILNTATGLRGLIQFLADEAPPPMREDTSMLAGYFEQMVEEILTQKQLRITSYNVCYTKLLRGSGLQGVLDHVVQDAAQQHRVGAQRPAETGLALV